MCLQKYHYLHKSQFTIVVEHAISSTRDHGRTFNSLAKKSLPGEQWAPI
jgi:hypothetical protein